MRLQRLFLFLCMIALLGSCDTKKDKKGFKKGAKESGQPSKEKVASKKAPAGKAAKSVKAKTIKEPVEKQKKIRQSANVDVSPELAAVVGSPNLPRAEALKKVWDYIRAHNLQDPKNKRVINPDALLAKVFGTSEPTDMFKMTALLNKHIVK